MGDLRWIDASTRTSRRLVQSKEPRRAPVTGVRRGSAAQPRSRGSSPHPVPSLARPSFRRTPDGGIRELPEAHCVEPRLAEPPRAHLGASRRRPGRRELTQYRGAMPLPNGCMRGGATALVSAVIRRWREVPSKRLIRPNTPKSCRAYRTGRELSDLVYGESPFFVAAHVGRAKLAARVHERPALRADIDRERTYRPLHPLLTSRYLIPLGTLTGVGDSTERGLPNVNTGRVGARPVF